MFYPKRPIYLAPQIFFTDSRPPINDSFFNLKTLFNQLLIDMPYMHGVKQCFIPGGLFAVKQCFIHFGHCAVKQCFIFVGLYAVKQCFIPVGHCAVKRGDLLPLTTKCDIVLGSP